MTPTGLTEGNLAEQPALEWFRRLGYQTALGPDISPGGARPGAKKGEKYPLLSERRNIIVIVNEAHRSQYRYSGYRLTAPMASTSELDFLPL